MLASLKSFFPSNAPLKCFIMAFAAIDLPGRFMMISGPSMLPTLNSELDILWLTKTRPKDLKVGDVAVFCSPVEHDKKLVKRVVALENQWVFSRFTGKPVFIPSGHCWLEGDNYPNSHDSNGMGPVPVALLHGTSTLRLYPWDRHALKCEPNRNAVRLFDPEDPYRMVKDQIDSLPGIEKMSSQQREYAKSQILQAEIERGAIR